MTRSIAGFLAGLVFASCGLAFAASARLVTLRSGDQAQFQGVLCTTSGAAHAVACALANENWYTVALSRRQVAVLDKAGHPIFFKQRR